MSATFSIVHRVQFSETDMAGVVHFSSFFKWMEEVEHAFFRSLGMSVSMQHDNGGGGMHVGWPRVKATCDYSGPVKFEDEVTCAMTVEKIGGKSFTYSVVFSVGGRDVAKGSITSVCCEILPGGGMKGIEIPPTIRAKLTAR